MSEYDLDIELTSREAAGEPGPRVPVFAPSGRLPRPGQLSSLWAIERAIASGVSDGERIARTRAYAEAQL